MTETWDPAIPLHKAIAHEIEIGTGVPELRHISKSRKALINVGFQIEQEEDLAERPDSVRWFYPLEGNILKAQSLWDILLVFGTTYIGMFITHFAMWIMELFGMMPQGTQEVVKAMRICRTGLIRGGQTKVRILYMVSSAAAHS
jgi:sterol 24-C-methyltransferase